MARMNDNLVRIMERERVSVRELSRRTGMSLSTLRRLRGSSNAGTVATWLAIADAMDVDITEFFDVSGTESFGGER